MVQKQVQKAKADGNAVMDEITMPQFMSKSPRGTGYLFRRGVPADIRASIGKREFKFSLGGNYQAACQRCRELAVETDRQIAMARAGSAAQPDLSSTGTTNKYNVSSGSNCSRRCTSAYGRLQT